MLQAIEINPGSGTQRISRELGISQSIVIRHLHDLGKSMLYCWIVPQFTKILQNFWLTQEYFIWSFDSNYTRMLQGILNKCCRQHSIKQQLYSHLPPIMKTIQVRQTRCVAHCWRSRDELISDVLLWNPSHGRAKAGRQTRTYIQQLCADTGCSLEDLLWVMNDREGWCERVREIHAGGATRWSLLFCFIYDRINSIDKVNFC